MRFIPVPHTRTPRLRDRFPRTIFSAASVVAKTLMCSASPTCLLVFTLTKTVISSPCHKFSAYRSTVPGSRGPYRPTDPFSAPQASPCDQHPGSERVRPQARTARSPCHRARLQRLWRNASPTNPNINRTAPATISQCGYSIDEKAFVIFRRHKLADYFRRKPN
jgi:hypothetical protein